MATIAAPVILAEMQDWKHLGGGNSGIVGDENHAYGFHIGARYVSSSDYSRRRDPNGSDGPFVDWDYACAGDFSHGYDPALRKLHRAVLARLMRGELPMICEFIGKPWADRPVYYWARWNGIATLQKYTGAGHDHWSHISWYRSKVNKRANLWERVEEEDMAITEAEFEKIAEKSSYETWARENPTLKKSYSAIVRGLVDEVGKLAGQVAGLAALVQGLITAPPVDITEAQLQALSEAISAAAKDGATEAVESLRLTTDDE